MPSPTLKKTHAVFDAERLQKKVSQGIFSKKRGYLFTAEPAENVENLESHSLPGECHPSGRTLTLQLISKPTLQPESFR